MNTFSGSRCRNEAESLESLDSESLADELVIGYANSRQRPIDAGTVWVVGGVGGVFFEWCI
jgi:hypothetical protein